MPNGHINRHGINQRSGPNGPGHNTRAFDPRLMRLLPGLTREVRHEASVGAVRKAELSPLCPLCGQFHRHPKQSQNDDGTCKAAKACAARQRDAERDDGE